MSKIYVLQVIRDFFKSKDSFFILVQVDKYFYRTVDAKQKLGMKSITNFVAYPGDYKVLLTTKPGEEIDLKRVFVFERKEIKNKREIVKWAWTI